ncbi:MAG: gfo/Idh/MocA family oxidoreductase [Proteobacteria bacterium]|nr:gfo/Idh/MocA family oxidoreductase [Pseudomonadota bacterium]
MSIQPGKPIRCALVGLGRISAKHLEAIAALPAEMELVAVCDHDPQTLAAFNPAHSAQRFTDIDVMLAQAQPDIVSICTPSGLHPQHGIVVAGAGRHVIVEKPMATSWQQGLALLEATKKGGGQFFMVLQNRYNDTIRALKSAMDEGRFGRIYMLTSNVFWTRPQSYYDQAAWRGTWALDGGAFMNQASHYVDMMGWLGGDVVQVQASIATLARRIEAEDTGAAIFSYKNGAVGTLSVTMLTYPKNREGSITVLGEKGYVRIGGTAMNVVEAWEFADKKPEDDSIMQASYATDSVYGNGHAVFYARVIAALRAGRAPEIDGEEGLKSLELLCAIYDSAKTGRAVALPLARA